MVIDTQSTIQHLQNDMQRYGRQLSGSEYLTRKVLVDPLLESLGWDILDDGLVVVEYNYGSGQQRTDYALGANGPHRSVCFVEAKKLGDLDRYLGSASGQKYVNDLNHRAHYVALTDGDVWIIYSTRLAMPGTALLESIPVLERRISNQPVDSVAKRFLEVADWLNNVNVTPNPDTLPWVPLPDFEPSELPRRIRFPDGSHKSIRAHYQVVSTTAEWLWEKGDLTANNAEMFVGGKKRLFITVNSKSAKWRPICNDELFLAPNIGAPPNHPPLECAKILLEHCEIPASEVQLQKPLFGR